MRKKKYQFLEEHADLKRFGFEDAVDEVEALDSGHMRKVVNEHLQLRKIE